MPFHFFVANIRRQVNPPVAFFKARLLGSGKSRPGCPERL
jgi:hypothetical protein